jgi:hypothetical protein
VAGVGSRKLSSSQIASKRTQSPYLRAFYRCVFIFGHAHTPRNLKIITFKVQHDNGHKSEKKKQNLFCFFQMFENQVFAFYVWIMKTVPFGPSFFFGKDKRSKKEIYHTPFVKIIILLLLKTTPGWRQFLPSHFLVKISRPEKGEVSVRTSHSELRLGVVFTPLSGRL